LAKGYLYHISYDYKFAEGGYFSAALRKENELRNIETLMSSNSDEWATPKKLFEDLNEEFHFTLDPCSTDLNFKCEKHFTLENDGLSQNWGGVQSILQSTLFTD
jgi:site-specific DNA-methyltransferase (adenine-specific)